MPIGQCPGQDKRFWKSTDVFDAPCANCGKVLEFWKDEPKRRCTGCGQTAMNPNFDMGCAKWCSFATECLGLTPGAEADESLCQSLIREMKAVFGDDRKRIQHALEVLNFAEQIVPSLQADPLVVKASAVLHDIGIRAAERTHGSSAGTYQEIEGPPIARGILGALGVDAQRIEHICRIVGSHHSANDVETPEFRIIWDADRLANAAEECAGKDPQQLREWIDKVYRTDAGRDLARYKLLGAETP